MANDDFDELAARGEIAALKIFEVSLIDRDVADQLRRQLIARILRHRGHTVLTRDARAEQGALEFLVSQHLARLERERPR